jgi:hypothetical protein
MVRYEVLPGPRPRPVASADVELRLVSPYSGFFVLTMGVLCQSGLRMTRCEVLPMSF